MNSPVRKYLMTLALAAMSLASLAQAPKPTPPPLPKPPGDQFRELLAASPAEREAMLRQRSPAARQIIRAKLREFEPLSPDQRELRLRMAQLQFYLSPLLRLPPGERGARLAQVPESERELITDRLKAWDQLPAEAQREVLENERALSWFLRVETVDPMQRMLLLGSLPRQEAVRFESALAKWKARPEAERQRTMANFQRFFELTPGERDKTLKTLSDTERRQMEQTLRNFAGLPAEQRQRCVRAFRQFAGMTPDERAGFLQSAAVWQKMTPDERTAWRRLVDTLPTPPPLPPVPRQVAGER